jgi:hypothetical protein
MVSKDLDISLETLTMTQIHQRLLPKKLKRPKRNKRKNLKKLRKTLCQKRKRRKRPQLRR